MLVKHFKTLAFFFLFMGILLVNKDSIGSLFVSSLNMTRDHYSYNGNGGWNDNELNSNFTNVHPKLTPTFLFKIHNRHHSLMNIQKIKSEYKNYQIYDLADGNGDLIHKVEYEVQPNDNLISIAKKFNINVASIAGSSDVQYVDQIKIGQKLYIPTQRGFFYKVQSGDTLALILEKYDVSLLDFIDVNPAINLDSIHVGDEFFLLNAKPKNLVRGWSSPVKRRILTSSYGWRRKPWKSFHRGIDLKAYYEPVYSVKPGRVVFAGRWGGYGLTVIVRHSSGFKTLYGHLSNIYVKIGKKVTHGEVIAKSGNSGRSTGPHLHFEILKNGTRINPRKYIVGLRYQRSYRNRVK